MFHYDNVNVYENWVSQKMKGHYNSSTSVNQLFNRCMRDLLDAEQFILIVGKYFSRLLSLFYIRWGGVWILVKTLHVFLQAKMSEVHTINVADDICHYSTPFKKRMWYLMGHLGPYKRGASVSLNMFITFTITFNNS